MRSLFYVVTALAVMAIAVWAYRQNYATQASLRDAEALRSEISELRETLGVLRAEWAYLNRPDRLRELADLNFDRLGLLPFSPEHFGQADQVAYPPEPLATVGNAVDVIGTLEVQE